MKITILGCGTSGGVPLVGGPDGSGYWGNCDAKNPKNRRRRASIYIENANERLLIDTSPDLREQLLTNRISKLDTILFTHAHADHMHGIDDLRAVNFNTQKVLNGYTDQHCFDALKRMFPYIFENHPNFPQQTYYKPAIDLEKIAAGIPFKTLNNTVIPFRQIHGYVESLGFKVGNMAYSTDVREFPEESEQHLYNLDLWIVDCLQRRPHNTHAHFDITMAWIEKFKPKRAILTHMNHEMDYDSLCAVLPENIRPAYDGMILEC